MGMRLASATRPKPSTRGLRSRSMVAKPTPSAAMRGMLIAEVAAADDDATREYFRSTIVPADPFWRWAGRYLSETTLVALYRASFFYGVARWVAWLIWAHLVRSFAFDFTWGGPKWVDAVHAKDLNASGCGCPSCCSASPKLALTVAVAAASRLASRKRD
jgi:hypothetical protein